jgi:hypothetical protein
MFLSSVAPVRKSKAIPVVRMAEDEEKARFD